MADSANISSKRVREKESRIGRFPTIWPRSAGCDIGQTKPVLRDAKDVEVTFGFLAALPQSYNPQHHPSTRPTAPDPP